MFWMRCCCLVQGGGASEGAWRVLNEGGVPAARLGRVTDPMPCDLAVCFRNRRHPAGAFKHHPAPQRRSLRSITVLHRDVRVPMDLHSLICDPWPFVAATGRTGEHEMMHTL